MLDELRIRGLGVIDDATLRFDPGLTVVTGETGAGKTMVVSGLLLLFGARADAARVRAGAEQAVIDGTLDIPADSAVARRVRDAGGELDDGTGLVLRRTVGANSRSRAFVGGAPTPVAVLGELADGLLTVHGQADQARLTRPGEQRAVLDGFAGIDTAELGRAFGAWRAAGAALDERRARAGELRRESGLLEYGLAEIAAADPQPGEDDKLAGLAARLTAADALRAAARTAHDALLGDPDDPAGDGADVAGLLGTARRALVHQDGADPTLDALAARVHELTALAADLGGDLAAYLADLATDLDADPDRLDRVQARRAVLAALVRKYADDADEPDLAGVARWAQAARARLATIDVSDDALAELARVRDSRGVQVARLAAEVSGRRAEAAGRLGVAVSAELAGLAMPNAVCTVEVRRRPPVAGAPALVVPGGTAGASTDGASMAEASTAGGASNGASGEPAGAEVAIGPDGVDDVELVLRPHPDAPALPIARGASGGELSRVMLALEVSLAGTDPVPTMVFDEVDAGVGGRAAVEVGRRLARLARSHQVVVVTHLAQVAAYADRHVVVDKRSERGGVTASDVRAVEGTERVAELARMLGGSASATAREHAAELLAAAAAEHPAAAERTTKRPAERPAEQPAQPPVRMPAGQRQPTKRPAKAAKTGR